MQYSTSKHPNETLSKFTSLFTDIFSLIRIQLKKKKHISVFFNKHIVTVSGRESEDTLSCVYHTCPINI